MVQGLKPGATTVLPLLAGRLSQPDTCMPHVGRKSPEAGLKEVPHWLCASPTAKDASAPWTQYLSKG